MGKSTISMAIFNSYVKLPEGIDHTRFLSNVHGPAPVHRKNLSETMFDTSPSRFWKKSLVAPNYKYTDTHR